MHNPKVLGFRTYGFTLVEMAVVMVLIGIVLTMSINGGLLLLSSSAIRSTKDKQIVIREALISYLRTNGRLSCPDVGPPAVTSSAIAAGVVLDGLENRSTSGDPTTNCASPFGAVPYADLGLSRDLALDAWGNYMLYRVSNSPTASLDWVKSTPATKAANKGAFKVSDHAATPVVIDVVAAIISHGMDGAGAWTTRVTKTAPPDAIALDEIENAAGPCAKRHSDSRRPVYACADS